MQQLRTGYSMRGVHGQVVCQDQPMAGWDGPDLVLHVGVPAHEPMLHLGRAECLGLMPMFHNNVAALVR
jgi:hypothetical protein